VRFCHLYPALLCLCISTTATAQLDAQGLRRELIAMEQSVHQDPAGVLARLENFDAPFQEADGETRLWYLLRRAQAHNALFMYEEFEEDIELTRAARISGASRELVLWLQTYAGIVEIRHGELKRGIEILADVSEQALNIDARRLYVFATQELAFTRGLLEQYDTSLEELQRAYGVAIDLNQPDLIAMVNDAYGAVYAYIGDYPRSIEFYTKALEDFQELGYKEHTASVIQGLASTYRYSRQWGQAERYFNKYLEVTSYAPGNSRLFYGNYGLALTFAEQGDCDRAAPQITAALQHRGPDDYDAELYKELAICEALAGNIEAAENALGKAASIFGSMPELDGTTWELELDYVRSQIEYHRGNLTQGFDVLDAYHKAYVEQMAAQSSNSMNMLRAGLESERKDLEIALLERQAELNELQVESHRQANQYQRYLIIFGAILGIMILAGFVFQWRFNRRLLALSHRDGLSGLYNRAYTFDYLDSVIPRITVNSGGLSLILIDIDNFKTINDSYGHPMGDEVIRQVANIAQSSLRNRDILGRIGGEEFLCVLPRTTREQCAQVARRLLDSIVSEEFYAEDGSKFSVSISIGTADFESSIKNSDELYSRADRALYQSKADGKGRITSYHNGLAAGSNG
jgi:diguanylate cyclase (GGDEF)-like protein